MKCTAQQIIKNNADNLKSWKKTEKKNSKKLKGN
jgi:hypothetical protein